MTGKNTFDTPGGHPSPGWSVIPSVFIPPSTWTTIEDALGAALTDVQKEVFDAERELDLGYEIAGL